MKREHVIGYIKHLFFILVAAGVGISSVLPLIDWEKADLSPAFLAPIAWGIIRAAWLEYTVIKAKHDSLP